MVGFGDFRSPGGRIQWFPPPHYSRPANFTWPYTSLLNNTSQLHAIRLAVTFSVWSSCHCVWVNTRSLSRTVESFRVQSLERRRHVRKHNFGIMFELTSAAESSRNANQHSQGNHHCSDWNLTNLEIHMDRLLAIRARSISPMNQAHGAYQRHMPRILRAPWTFLHTRERRRRRAFSGFHAGHGPRCCNQDTVSCNSQYCQPISSQVSCQSAGPLNAAHLQNSARSSSSRSPPTHC